MNSSGGKADISTFTGMLGDYAYPSDIVDYGCSVDVGYGLTPFEAESLNSSKMVNNSSRQVIVSHGGFKIVFSGDVEADGWGALLQNIGFRSALSGTNVFVASHHGHSSGYSKEIFNAMGKPDVVVVSAESGDPHVDGGYSDSKNVKGILYRDFGVRYMLSTRNDGSMVIDVSDDGRYTIELNDFPDNIFDDAGF